MAMTFDAVADSSHREPHRSAARACQLIGDITQSTVGFNLVNPGVSLNSEWRRGEHRHVDDDVRVNGAPGALTISVLGVIEATGDTLLLDSYSGTTNTTRTISLTESFDSFQVLAVWTGGSSSVGVSGTASFVGSGETFQGSVTLITGLGNPNGVVNAPIGALYSNLSGSPGSVFFVTTGAIPGGWTAVA
jgi:hypothetical protein